MWQYQTASFALLLSGILSLVIVTSTLPKRHTPTGVSFIVLAGAASVWSFSEFITLGLVNPDAIAFWTGVTFIGIGLVPTSILVFTLYYTGRGHYLTRPILATLIIASTWQPIAVWTSPWHHLFYKDFSVIPIERGPLFALHTAISYAIIFTCLVVLFLLHARAAAHRSQIRMLFAVVLLPGFANMLFVARIIPSEFGSVDLTPLTFTLCIFVLSSRVFRSGLFDILPVAHRHIFYALNDPMIVIDPQGNIADMNEAARKLIHQPLHDVLQRPAAAVFPPLATSLQVNDDINNTGSEVTWESTGKTYQVRLSPLRDQRLSIRGRIILLHDITEQKQADQELRKQYDMVQELAQKHKSALYSADLANQTKDKFLANMSHELRTPLNAILGYTGLVVDEAEEHHYKELIPDLKKVQSSGQHLLDIITHLLDLTKIETQDFDLYFEHFPINALIRELENDITPLLQQQSNTIHIDIDSSLPEVYGDERRVYQVLLNVLHNAVRFTHNGRIEVNVVLKDNKWVHCTISDNGIGIPAEQLKMIFQPFAQGDDSMTRAYNGIGIGLTMSRRLCRLMGAVLTLESEEGVGTTVQVALPIEKQIEKQNTNVSTP